MASFEPRYLAAAIQLADEARARFWDEPEGAFRAAEPDGDPLPVPVFAAHDDAWPSGASTLCEAQILLSALTASPDRLAPARRYLERMREPMLSQPFAFGRLLCAAEALLDGAPSLVVAGEPQQASLLLREVDRRYAPTLALAWADPSGGTAEPLRSAFEGKTAPPGGARAYLCRDFECSLPTDSETALARSLEVIAPG